MDQITPPDPASATIRAQSAAFAVHLFTAMGAGIALLAMLEAVREHWANMFGWLGLALIVDAIDGPLARKLDVIRLQPNWSGDILDLVVDFLTYVFVPAYAITASGMLLPIAAPLLGIGIMVSSALYFADRRMKASDNHFRGFPALWNAAAFYLFLLHLPPVLVDARHRPPDRTDIRAVPCPASGPGGAPALADAVADGRRRCAGDLYAGLRFQRRRARRRRALRHCGLCNWK